MHLAAFSAIQKESERLGLMVNERKTKYMQYSSREAQRNQCQTEITTDGHTFEAVKEFTYLGNAITAQNDISLEIKRRMTLAHRCYCGLIRQMCNRALSRQTKINLYKTLILQDAHSKDQVLEDLSNMGISDWIRKENNTSTW